MKKSGLKLGRTLFLPYGWGIKFCYFFCTKLEQDLSVLVWRSAVLLLHLWILVQLFCYLVSFLAAPMTAKVKVFVPGFLLLKGSCLSPRATWKLPRAEGCYYTTLHLVSSLALFLHQLGNASDLASGRTGLSTRSLNIHRRWITISASKNLGVGSICLDARNLSSLASGCKPHLAGSVMHILGLGLAPLKPADCCKLIGRTW